MSLYEPDPEPKKLIFLLFLAFFVSGFIYEAHRSDDHPKNSSNSIALYCSAGLSGTAIAWAGQKATHLWHDSQRFLLIKGYAPTFSMAPAGQFSRHLMHFMHLLLSTVMGNIL